MSSKHYEDLWRVGVAELVGLLDAEHPEDRAAAPKKLDDWARLYVRYVQTYGKLCAAHNGLVHPQKRAALRASLEACLGRMLELRAYLAQLNDGVSIVDLGKQLSALQLNPESLDLPVPAYFHEARSEALAARAAAAAAAALAASQAGQPTTADDVVNNKAEVAAGKEGEVGLDAGDPGALHASQQNVLVADNVQSPAVGTPTVAPDVPVNQAQPGESSAPAAEQPLDAELDEDPEGAALRSTAATKLQSGVRGWLARRALADERQQELEFLGMAPPTDGRRSAELDQQVAAVALRRMQAQVWRQAELDEAMVGAKAGLRQREGWTMKERIRDQLSEWFLKSRDPETGKYADLPDAAKGGSRDIVYPRPPEPTPEEAAAAAAAAAKAASKAGSSGKGGKGGALAAPRMTAAFLAELQGAVQQYMDVWQEYEAADPTLPLLPKELQGLPQARLDPESYDSAMVTEEVRPVVFEEMRLEADEEMRRLIQNIKDTIQAGKNSRKKKGGKKGDGKAGKKAGSGGKKGGKEKGKGAADQAAAPPKKKRKDLTAGRSIESIFAELASAGLVPTPAPARLEDFLGGERLAAEPASALTGPAAEAASAAGKPKVGGKKANAAATTNPPGKAPAGAKGKAAGAGEEPAKAYPEPSLAQARQAVAADCVLPLGAHQAMAKLQPPRAVLLYGPPGTGKTLLARAVAHQAGATTFDLSPATTEGKYPGKAAALMVHMVFKAARVLAPSVVLVESVDAVFVSDRTRAKALAGPSGEPPNRVKKQLLAEVADLEPGDGVLVLCTSRQPQACVKKDDRALRTFLQRYIQLPLPEYGARRTLLQEFARREGVDLGPILSLLSQVSAGLSAGQLEAFVKQVAEAHTAAEAAAANSCDTAAASRCASPDAADIVGTEKGRMGTQTPVPQQAQQAQLAEHGQQAARRQPPAVPSVEELALVLLPAFKPVDSAEVAALKEWTARVHQPLPLEEEPKDGKKGAKKK